MQNQGKATLPTLLMSVFLVPHDGARLIGITWSLEYEMMFYLAFAAIASVGVWGPATLNSIGVPQLEPFILGFVLNLHVGEFMLGMVAAWLIQRDFRLRRPGLLLAAALLAGALFAVYETRFLPLDQTLRSVTVTYGVIAATIVLAVVQTELRYPIRIPGWLNLLGAASYAIYLTHYLVVSLAVVVARHVPALATIPAPLLLLVRWGERGRYSPSWSSGRWSCAAPIASCPNFLRNTSTVRATVRSRSVSSDAPRSSNSASCGGAGLDTSDESATPMRRAGVRRRLRSVWSSSRATP